MASQLWIPTLIQNTKKTPETLSSIHDQNTIFIQISHIAKLHSHTSIFGSTQIINQSVQKTVNSITDSYNSSRFIIGNKLKTTIFCIVKVLFSLVLTQTPHKAKSHIAKSIIEDTQIPNQNIKCNFMCCRLPNTN